MRSPPKRPANRASGLRLGIAVRATVRFFDCTVSQKLFVTVHGVYMIARQ
jgi:hypothetical protein